MKKKIILAYFCPSPKIEKLKKFVETKLVVCSLPEPNSKHHSLVHCVSLYCIRGNFRLCFIIIVGGRVEIKLIILRNADFCRNEAIILYV